MSNKNNQYLRRLRQARNARGDGGDDGNSAAGARKSATPDFAPGLVSRAWDNLVAVFSPRRALQNAALRDKYRRYAGAKTTPSLSSYWSGGDKDPNASIRQNRQAVANRVRQLVKDMPWLDGSLESAADYWVGEGFNFKPAVVDEAGLMVRDVNKTLKDAFLRWCESAGADNRANFGDLQRLAVRQIIECGEAVFLHRHYKDGYRLLPLESDSISARYDIGADNVDQGIKFDPERNFNIEYYFSSNQFGVSGNDTYSVKAENVIHLFKQKRPWQRRGISPLVQTILIAADLDEFLSGEMSAQQMASRWLAFVTDPNGDATEGYEDELRLRTVLDTLTIETLPPGKSIQLAGGASRPTLGLETFQKIFLRVLSVILRIPYSVISGDYQNLNYNTLREIRNNTVHRLKSEWGYLEHHFLIPVYRHWMDYAVLNGDVDLPGYFKPGGKWHYQRCFWLPPGIESVDVLRDIKGVLLASQSGMYDPQDWIMSQGEDPEEILAGTAEFQRLLKSYGIELKQSDEDTNLPSGADG